MISNSVDSLKSHNGNADLTKVCIYLIAMYTYTCIHAFKKCVLTSMYYVCVHLRTSKEEDNYYVSHALFLTVLFPWGQ